MKIGIMQPYFLPYIGYFQLIDSVDTYVNLDHVSFMKRSYMVRNKLKNEVGINLSVIGGSQNKKCKEVNIYFDDKWIKKFKTSINYLYSKEDNYSSIMDTIVNPMIDDLSLNVSDFNFSSVKRICHYLDINKNFIDSSGGVTENKKGQGLIDICKKNNSSSYVNAIGGMNLYNKEEFKKSGIELYFCKMNNDIDLDDPYLSILHQLFVYSKEHLKNQIKKYKLI
jgi:hypothetical protein